MPPARGTKTLAWFMDTDILKNGGGGGGQEGAVGATPQSQFNPAAPAWSMVRRESSSDESKSTTPSSIPQSQCHLHYLSKLHKENPQKKAKRLRKVSANAAAAARRDGYVASSAMSSESSEDGTGLPTSPPPPPPQVMTTSTTSSNGAPSSCGPTSSGTTAVTSGGGGGNNNEEYWFYDVASDGYYYEQNGAKGWRRRQPNSAVHKANNGKEQEVAHMNVNGQAKYNQLLAAQQAAAQAAFFQQAYHMQQVHAVMSQPPPPPPPPPPTSSASASGATTTQNTTTTMRYYDPTSDGFFYEMASVDGWKRRQPNKPVSASVPAGITRPYSQRSQMHGVPPTASYGAALARGQFPRNTVKQEEEMIGLGGRIHQDSTGSRDSASSSISGDNTASAHFAELFNGTDPLFNPVQRPSALNLEQKAVSPKLENAPSSTAALFDAMLADLNNGGVKTPAYSHPLANYSNPNQQSSSPMKPPGDSWNSFRSCSLFSPIKPSKRVVLGVAPSASQQPMGSGTPCIEDMVDDDTMKMLMRDLDKLWANTPVSGLNQA